MPRHGLLWGRGTLGEGDCAVLEVGKTTREEALLRFGPPEITLEDGRILIYDWGVSVGFAPTIFGTAPDISSDSSLVLEFGGDGRLLRYRLTPGGGWSGALEKAKAVLREWYPAGEPWPERWVVETDPLPDLWSRLGAAAGSGLGIRVRLRDFRDGRPAAVDQRTLGKFQDIYYLGVVEARATRPLGDVVAAAVARQLESEGFQLTDTDPDAEVSGVIDSFDVGTFSIEFAVTLDAVALPSRRTIRRRYERTWVKDEPGDYRIGPREALLDLQDRIAADRELSLFLEGGRQP